MLNRLNCPISIRAVCVLCVSILSACGRSTSDSEPGLRADRKAGHFAPGQIFSDRLKNALYGPELIVIPAGTFILGAVPQDKQASNQEKPAHRVTIQNDFAIGRTEVTVAQFAAFIAQTGYITQAERTKQAEVFDMTSGRLVRRAPIDWRYNYIGQKSSAQYPVLYVAFDDALAYTHWLSKRTGQHYRLPSEAEWEYTLRANTQSIYPWGDKIKGLTKGNLSGELDVFPNERTWGNAIKNYSDGYWALAPVRRYSSEGFGTFDLLGNVSEWVEDCWHENYRRAPGNAQAWVNPGCLYRVVRGSAWLSALDHSRASFRESALATRASAHLGFRVVREL